MDEHNTGIDPEVRRYFRKIINSFFLGLLWLMSILTAGLFFNLGIIKEGIKWYNIIFYLLALASLSGLIYFYYKIWNGKE